MFNLISFVLIIRFVLKFWLLLPLKAFLVCKNEFEKTFEKAKEINAETQSVKIKKKKTYKFSI